jgi:STE24 endopeptidase
MKGVAISAVLGGVLLGLLLYLVAYGGEVWWIWAWMLVGLFELLMMWIFPIVIAPLFNKFGPIEDPALEHEIRFLAEKAGLQVKGIFAMDASKRSKHTNAFFTGIGRSKRIVLFDTLLNSHAKEEVLAVLAHEIGHWKKKHVLKSLILVEILSWIGFFIGARSLGWPLLYQTFGFTGFTEPVAYAGLFLIGIFLGVLAYFIQPLESAISRRFEREADDFVLEMMGTTEPMRKALKRLAADNLANLIPHPLYAWFYYSHPPLLQRIERLRSKISKPLLREV